MKFNLAYIAPIAVSVVNPADSFPNDKLFALVAPIRIDNLYLLEDKLESLKLLGRNWDGYDAEELEEVVLSNAAKFLQVLPQSISDKLMRDDITPTSYGTVVIDWRNYKDEFVSIEIGHKSLGFFSEFNDKNNFTLERHDFNENFLPDQLFSAFIKLFKD